MPDARRSLPAVGTLVDSPLVQQLCGAAPRGVVAAAARAVVERARQQVHLAPSTDSDWATAVADEVKRRERPSLQRVFNATGVVLHTNLGRAPLPDAALEAISRTAAGASNLEYDLELG